MACALLVTEYKLQRYKDIFIRSREIIRLLDLSNFVDNNIPLNLDLNQILNINHNRPPPTLKINPLRLPS